jgi:hypothetical protein
MLTEKAEFPTLAPAESPTPIATELPTAIPTELPSPIPAPMPEEQEQASSKATSVRKRLEAMARHQYDKILQKNKYFALRTKMPKYRACPGGEYSKSNQNPTALFQKRKTRKNDYFFKGEQIGSVTK